MYRRVKHYFNFLWHYLIMYYMYISAISIQLINNNKTVFIQIKLHSIHINIQNKTFLFKLFPFRF